jgi:hypothetical protein
MSERRRSEGSGKEERKRARGQNKGKSWLRTRREPPPYAIWERK